MAKRINLDKGRATKSEPHQALVLMSGGIDSTACAHLLQQQGHRVTAVFFDYGQAAARAENIAVTALTAQLGIPLKQFVISGSELFALGELVGRNAFLIFGAVFLTRVQTGLLAMGIHAGTHYYDCSVPFAESITRLVAEHTDGRVSFVAPFLTWSKNEVYHYFCSANLPSALTYSCESGTTPCGVCASCRDRKRLEC